MIWNLWLIVFEKTTWRSFVWVIYTVFADEMGRYEKQQEHTHNSKKYYDYSRLAKWLLNKCALWFLFWDRIVSVKWSIWWKWIAPWDHLWDLFHSVIWMFNQFRNWRNSRFNFAVKVKISTILFDVPKQFRNWVILSTEIFELKEIGFQIINEIPKIQWYQKHSLVLL